MQRISITLNSQFAILNSSRQPLLLRKPPRVDSLTTFFPRPSMFFHKKAPHEPGCMVMHLVVSALLFLVSLAALVGVYKAHFLGDGSMTFGTSAGSLSLIALGVSLTLWMHQMKNCFTKCEVCK